MPIPLQNLNRHQKTSWGCLFLFVLSCQLSGQDLAKILDRIEAIEKQNKLLIQQVGDQQAIIENLRKQLSGINETSDRQNEHIVELQETAFDIPSDSSRQSLGNSIHISGEAGVVFRAGEANTNFPNEEFRVDEARLFIEAQIADKTYIFSELELFSRETINSDLEIGELYIEFEEVLAIADWDRAVNFRMGRLNIPFGEEYLKRDVMDNPLISHSVADFWGIDEGIEAFGEMGNFSYVLALLNGSQDRLRDFTSDKSVVARAGFDLTNQLHFGGSFMRTGDIDPEKEVLTELWFGNGFFRSIGSESTTKFDVEIAQLESTFAWQNGELKVDYGEIWYRDNDPNSSNSRDFEFWQIEAQQEIGENLYAAARYSGMNVDKGYPVAGMAARGFNFFGPFFAKELRRLSLGFTYWVHSDVVIKLDYTMEDGDQLSGSKRSNTDIFSAEVGARF